MYEKIMVPVDLAHLDQLQKAIKTAADLARLYASRVCFVGATTPTPGPMAHTPEEFKARFEAFAAEQQAALGVPIEARVYIAHDPSIDLDDTLLRAISETGADLVVTASHNPGFAEHLFASNSGYLAAHAPVSVLVVRS
ncbi:MAG: universal stress protein [Gammaproteobacteria bacterium]|nr:universal stress protein [Gammaproteobacteria bacterium]